MDNRVASLYHFIGNSVLTWGLAIFELFNVLDVLFKCFEIAAIDINGFQFVDLSLKDKPVFSGKEFLPFQNAILDAIIFTFV